MAEIHSQDILTEKAFEIILNFKPSDKYDKAAVNEILKLQAEIKKLILILPKPEQEVLSLRYFNNLTDEKIANQVGRTRDEINKILSGGINTVKGKLGKDTTVLDNVQKTIDISKIKFESKEQMGIKTQAQQPVQKAVNQVQPGTRRKPSFFAIIFSLAFYVLFFAGVYFIVQKYIFPNLPQLTSFISGSKESRIEVKKDIKTNTDDQYSIKISGSSSLFILARRLENSFNVNFPLYHINLTSSDSDKGIKSLIAGNSDIANSSRPLTYSDRKKIVENGFELLESRIALDALIIIVNKNNTINEITVDELEKIFRGDVKNWKGISDGSFVKTLLPVVRENGSGTNEFVINRVLQGDNFPSSLLSKSSNSEAIKYVIENEGAIGFTNSTTYPWESPNIKYLRIKNYDNSIPVSPFEGKKLNENAIRYGDYPLAHYLYLITRDDSQKKVQEFVSWVLSKEGQKIVAYSGLIPVLKSEE